MIDDGRLNNYLEMDPNMLGKSDRRLNYLEIARRALIQELTSRVPSNN